MPRPKTVSDVEVIEAALATLAEKGPTFTITDIADRVNLSRATLIQRFGDRQAILLRMADFQVEQTRLWLAELASDSGPTALRQFLETIIHAMGEEAEFSAHVTIAALEARDPVLRERAAERYRLVQQAIAERAVFHSDPMGFAGHIHAIIAGATMQWVADPEQAGLADFILARLRWAIAEMAPENP